MESLAVDFEAALASVRACDFVALHALLESYTSQLHSSGMMQRLLLVVIVVAYVVLGVLLRGPGLVRWLLRFVVVALFVWPLLLLPIGLRLHSPSTMMSSVIVFMTVLHLSFLALWAPSRLSSSACRAPRRHSIPMGLWHWLCEFATAMFPVSWVNENSRPPWSAVFVTLFESLAIAAIKMVLYVLLFDIQLEHASSTDASTLDWPTLFKYSTMHSLMVLCGVWNVDIIHGLLPVLSLRRLSLLSFNQYPLLSSSVSEFWGRRYNRLISRWLHRVLFDPLRGPRVAPALAKQPNQQSQPQQPPRGGGGVSTSLAALATFAMSGVLHMYVVHFAFGTGYLRTLLFFLLHGLAGFLENALQLRQRLGPVFGTVLTITFVLASLPLYVGLFVEAGREWFLNTPDSIPPVAAQFARETVRPFLNELLGA